MDYFLPGSSVHEILQARILEWVAISFSRFDCVDHNKLENSSRWEHQAFWPASWEICVQVKKQQLELDMEQWTGSKLENEYVKAVYCHSAYLTYMQSTSCKMLGWMKPKLQKDCQEKYQ